MPKISIIIPAHNEEGNLGKLFSKLIPVLEHHPETQDFELIIVNDNSTDNTASIADEFSQKDKRIKAIHRNSSPGFGNAIKEGFKNAAGDILIPVMGDLSDDPEDIHKLVRRIEEGYDIAYGSRFIKGGSTEGYPPVKLMINRIANHFVRVLFKLKHQDITNAFKAYKKDVLQSIRTLEAEGFDLTLEMPIKAHIMGFTSCEVPVTWHGRERGKTKLKLSENTMKYGWRLLKLFFAGEKAVETNYKK